LLSRRNCIEAQASKVATFTDNPERKALSQKKEKEESGCNGKLERFLKGHT
jgi:hypothetical protein